MTQYNDKKKKILIICGPTASGKSDFAIKCAKMLDGEVVGADSVQIYRGLDIGSGKITESEMDNIPHHMIDILNPNQEYSVSDYVQATTVIIDDISFRGKLPIIAGGTGLYIGSLLGGHNFGDAAKNDAVRNKFKEILDQNGKEYIHEMLQRVDPESAAKISPNDSKRVIRALEIYEITGKPKSQAIKTRPECPYDYKILILNKEREDLYRDINLRVEKMFSLGLLNEVNALMNYKDCQSMQAIGYKETVQYLQNNATLEQTKETIKQNSRRYAKRQLTFFKGMSFSKQWLMASNVDGFLSKEIII